jgi:hypothetical protein
MNSSSLDIAVCIEGVERVTGVVNLFEVGLPSGSMCSTAFRFLVEATVVTKSKEVRCLDQRPNNDTRVSAKTKG